MVRWTPAVMIAKMALVAAAFAGCGGKAVHLGDGCPHAQVLASEVLWIGDTWITLPSTQYKRVQDLARAKGAIGPSDVYAVAAAPATTMAQIANQYYTAEAGTTKVKILIMDGGGWDTIKAGGSAASITAAGDAFKQLLTTVASDGTVQQIIYFLYPELPLIFAVRELRPVMQQACAESKVPCHFLDLEPLWAGHPEYTDSASNIQASEAGAIVIADQIWKIMQANCIAQ